LLVLTAGLIISEAYNGFETLTQEKIEEIYGMPPTFKNIKELQRLRTVE
jgi:hypothetical protein